MRLVTRRTTRTILMVEKPRATRRGAPERAVVVGAGPAGLAVAGALAQRGVVPLVLDSAENVASSWRGRYDRLRLNTPRWLAGLPGARLPRFVGRWPSREDYLCFLESYARAHVPRLEHGVLVERVERVDGGWLLATSHGEVRAAAVVIATGYDRVPVVPDWPGRDSFRGELFHSADYREPSPFVSRDVLVVGAGTSGNEIAVRLAEGGARRVRVAVRSRPWLVPRDWHGVPLPAVVYAGRRTPRLLDAAAPLLDRLLWGDLEKLGLPAPAEGPTTLVARTGHGNSSDSGLIAAIRSGRIEVLTAVTALQDDDVVLADQRRIQPEILIAATGYRCGLEPLIGHIPGVLRPDGRPAITGPTTSPAAPGLHTIGFRNPVSGQLPELRADARAIVQAITTRIRA